jgi:uncharacterized protein
VAGERHRVALPGGEELALVLHRPPTGGPVPVVVACHGLHASKDSDKYLLLAEALPRAGLGLARFDFRGAGESSGRAEATTVARQIEDVRAVLAFLDTHPAVDGRVGLLGSSLGGFVALHVARDVPGLRAVVTWNAPADLAALGLRAAESSDVPALRAEVIVGRLAAAPAGVSHHLVIHADADDVVPLEHGRRLHARAAAPRRLVVIAGGDHRLTEPAHRARAVAAGLDWFGRFLRGDDGD